MAKERGNKMKKIRLYVGIILLGIFCTMFLYSAWYVNDYYHSDDSVEQYLQSSDAVTVTQIDDGWFFDGKGEDNAIIFYPGAKVEETAYAPLLYELAENGTDCFLIKMPFRLAVLGINKASDIMDTYQYDTWYMAGHSLGGAMAAYYTKDHIDTLDGLIMLGAYSTVDLTSADFPVLVIYGSEDQVVNQDKLVAGRNLMPKEYTEYCIEGGNHAGYGNYGPQKGDGVATITKSEQQDITVEEIMQVFGAS